MLTRHSVFDRKGKFVLLPKGKTISPTEDFVEVEESLNIYVNNLFQLIIQEAKANPCKIKVPNRQELDFSEATQAFHLALGALALTNTEPCAAYCVLCEPLSPEALYGIKILGAAIRYHMRSVSYSESREELLYFNFMQSACSPDQRLMHKAYEEIEALFPGLTGFKFSRTDKSHDEHGVLSETHTLASSSPVSIYSEPKELLTFTNLETKIKEIALNEPDYKNLTVINAGNKKEINFDKDASPCQFNAVLISEEKDDFYIEVENENEHAMLAAAIVAAAADPDNSISLPDLVNDEDEALFKEFCLVIAGSNVVLNLICPKQIAWAKKIENLNTTEACKDYSIPQCALAFGCVNSTDSVSSAPSQENLNV